ncbi:hypothetical protein BET10_01000 [Pseudoalteromonas amylolytica]|uniref:Uncharacterized protein n=1 Tax=Pseudoalteromonas amylolytica TaxID=1859457 RepID=A0A1S1MPW6_9GAMM|nr:hypothetical protein BFC16_00935 [Pseudoalteromonas sp. JW3]OHU87213.1 hypothetical protein BET10_01000 [Pseudoalteromonas amylolytica]
MFSFIISLYEVVRYEVYKAQKKWALIGPTKITTPKQCALRKIKHHQRPYWYQRYLLFKGDNAFNAKQIIQLCLLNVNIKLKFYREKLPKYIYINKNQSPCVQFYVCVLDKNIKLM